MKRSAQVVRDLASLRSATGEVERAELLTWLRGQPELRQKPRREQKALPTGFSDLDAMLDGGLPQGAISEFVGRGSSGRTALSLAVLAAATQRGEAVAWIDPADALDPLTVRASGVCLPRFLWIRPNGRNALKQSLQAADLLLDAGGFAALVLDLAGTGARSMMRRPAWWVRLARRLEGTGTVFLALAASEIAGASCFLRLGCRPIGKRYLAEVTVLRMRGSAPGACARVQLGDPVD